MGRDDARNGGNGDPAASAGAGVDAGVEELNEMTIGRTDDPVNPTLAMALEAASLFGIGSRNPSGPAAMQPRQQAGHMTAIEPPVRFSHLCSCIQGAVHTCEAQRAEAVPGVTSRGTLVTPGIASALRASQ
jgi:hypothetical protein